MSRGYAANRNFDAFETDAIRHYFELCTLPIDLASDSNADLAPVLREVVLNQIYHGAVLHSGEDLVRIYDGALATLS